MNNLWSFGSDVNEKTHMKDAKDHTAEGKREMEEVPECSEMGGEFVVCRRRWWGGDVVTPVVTLTHPYPFQFEDRFEAYVSLTNNTLARSRRGLFYSGLFPLWVRNMWAGQTLGKADTRKLQDVIAPHGLTSFPMDAEESA